MCSVVVFLFRVCLLNCLFAFHLAYYDTTTCMIKTDWVVEEEVRMMECGMHGGKPIYRYQLIISNVILINSFINWLEVLDWQRIL
jgi:hypothetical protein